MEQLITDLSLPIQGVKEISLRSEMFLLICYYNPFVISKEVELLTCIQELSSFPITVLNLYNYCREKKDLPFSSALDLMVFDGIIIRKSVSYAVDSLKSLKLKEYQGIKILMQQENKTFAHLLEETGFEYSNIDEYLDDKVDDSVYENIVKQLDENLAFFLEKKALVKPKTLLLDKPGINLLLMVPHEPVKDPRLGWIAHTAQSKNINVIQLGLHAETEEIIVMMEGETENFIKRYPCSTWSTGCFDKYIRSIACSPLGMAAYQELMRLELLVQMPRNNLCDLVGAVCDNYRLDGFINHMSYVLNISAGLLLPGVLIRGIDIIVAADLPALPAALLLKSIFNIPVIYDAHEYWAEAFTNFSEFEIQYWRDLESRLVRHVDYCQTVSSGLATLMTQTYGVPFGFTPNCVPMRDIVSVPLRKLRSTTSTCKFLFQGLFAPARGAELLINAWPLTDERAILLLRGPDSAYKDNLISLAEKTGLLGTRIQFPAAVSEEQLMEGLLDADVGLIPYEPIGNNHIHCCPNKLSQYMAGKLPILANHTNFIKTILDKSGSGVVVDFNHTQKVVDAVAFFINEPLLCQKMGEKAYDYVIHHFHWEKVSALFYSKIDALVLDKKDKQVEMLFYEDKHKEKKEKEERKARMIREEIEAREAREKEETFMKKLFICFTFTYTKLMPKKIRKAISPKIRENVYKIFS